MAEEAHDIYDRMFKRILTLSGKVVVRFINGLFQTDYPENSKITYHWTEFEDDSLKKTLADAILTVNDTDFFHIEAQMDKDSDIVLRMMNYGMNQAFGSFQELPFDPACGQVWEMEFPRQIVIYLDEKPGLPEYYPVTIHFQGEESYTHHISVLSFQEKSLSEIKEKNLIVLLPFKLLSLRKDFEKERSEDNIRRLIRLYEDDIMGMIEQAYSHDQITNKDYVSLRSLTILLLRHLYSRYQEIQEALMRLYDQSLDLESDRLFDRIELLEEQIAEMDKQITEKDKQIAEKDKQIAEIEKQIAEIKKLIAEKNEESQRLKEEIEKYQ